MVDDKDLKQLIHSASPMTPEQKERQRKSFVYGNTKLSNDVITREHVDQMGNDIDDETIPDGWEARVLSSVAVFTNATIAQPQKLAPFRDFWISVSEESEEPPWVRQNIQAVLDVLVDVVAEYFESLPKDDSTDLYTKFLHIVEKLDSIKIEQGNSSIAVGRCSDALQHALLRHRGWMEKVQWDYAELFSTKEDA